MELKKRSTRSTSPGLSTPAGIQAIPKTWDQQISQADDEIK